MAIYRCNRCNLLDDFENAVALDENFYFCPPCHTAMVELLKPKIIKHDIYATTDKPNPKPKEIKKKAKPNGK